MIQTMDRYIVVRAASPAGLERKVNAYLDEEYVLLGGLAIESPSGDVARAPTYCQAMVRRERREKVSIRLRRWLQENA